MLRKETYKIKRYYLLAITLLCFQLSVFGREDKDISFDLKKEEAITKSYTTYKDWVITTNSSGELNIWDIHTAEKIHSIVKEGDFFTCVGKDNNDNLFIGAKESKIYKLNIDTKTLQLHLDLKKKYVSVLNIFFNSKNELFFISDSGIYSPSQEKWWTEFDQSGTIVSSYKMVRTWDKNRRWKRKRIENFFMYPDHLYKDKKGMIWMSKSYGEWGTSIHRFDVERGEIMNDTNYIGSHYLFEDMTDRIYGTNGSMHFFQSGSIDIIENDIKIASTDSDKLKNEKGELLFKGSVMLGPATFNSYNKKYYFSSTMGIYEAELDNNEFLNFKLYWQPTLNWKQEPMAIGYAMSYQKLEFISEKKLLLFTAHNGLGLYDGNKIRWLN